MSSTDTTADPYTGVEYNDGFHVRHYDVKLNYRVLPNRLEGEATLTIVAERNLDRLTLDLQPTMVVRRVSSALKFKQSGGKLRLQLKHTVGTGETFDLKIRYGGTPQPRRTRWGTLGWEELESGSLVASQPIGSPTWLPCDDHPSSKATFDLSVTADNPFTVVASGDLVSQTRQASTSTWRYRCSEPMATYLATVVVGEFRRVELGDRCIAYLPPGASVPTTLRLLPKMLARFEKLFGPYPFADYRVVVTEDALEIPLEAQGLAIFGRNNVTTERLMAHELAHQWFGNSLGLRRWRDIWLNEGFACYAEWLWAGTTDEHAARHYARLKAKPQDLLLSNPGPKLMFDDRVYKRGALALHAFREEMGDDPFFAAIRSYVAQGRHGLVEPSDLRTELHGVPHGLWDRWLNQEELP